MIVRFAQKHDLDSIYQIEVSAFSYNQMSKTNILYHIKNPNALFLVAVDPSSSLLAGYALVFLNKRTTTARLYGIGTMKSYRGRGIASLLLERVESLCLDNGKTKIHLEVKSTNEAALSLYKKKSYTPIALLPAYYDDASDGFRLQKCLLKDSSLNKENPSKLLAP